jgi:hypothetical protein
VIRIVGVCWERDLGKTESKTKKGGKPLKTGKEKKHCSTRHPGGERDRVRIDKGREEEEISESSG